MVENMSGLSCPHCGEMIEIFGSGGGERTASEMKIDFLARIPMDPRMVACADSGRSFQGVYPEAPVSRAYQQLAERVIRANGVKH
jgi:nitrogenase subunit NifH